MLKPLDYDALHLRIDVFFEAKPKPSHEAPDIYQDWNAASSSTQTGNGNTGATVVAWYKNGGD